MGKGVFSPPVKVSPSGTPWGDPASRPSKLIGLCKGGAKYHRASVNRSAAWIVIEPAHPLREAGLQNAAQSPSKARSGPSATSGSAGLEAEEAADGRGGGPATGTLDRLEGFAAGRSEALADML